ncbi:NAC domain-containing protein 2-like isoform X1 [Durio zibethinus]|uniref:NAC domain-containing protein 2-like isoform X1 n=1 Tax=Durio zibethinus TaxID=66656 RepID=A0A6P6A1V7_DURZI|nr:NAC domain-containing protein 2-like isoform X1 [Durio zibethinus]
MDMVKGFRFHPTDQELIEYLQIKTFDRDSVVQVIDEVQDICESEPWELAGRSALQTGDRLWYFMYPPKYKYRNSKRISRTTLEGYWKPTGNARKIINYDNGEEIGSKKTLVFYKGQCNDKNKNKTCWVMHEYELKADPKASDSDQRTFNLCKLKKKADISSTEAGQSSQPSLSNLENHVANNAMSQELLDPKGSSEPEASNGSDIVHNKSSSIETFAGERSNQHNISNYMHHVAEDAIPKEPLHVIEVSTEKNGPEDSNRVQKPYSTIEQDNESCNSILTNDGETVPIERSNQHNIVVAVESFEMPTNFEFLADEDLIPTDLFYNYGISLDELLAEPKATNNSNWIQNHSITNIEDEFLDSIFADNNEAYLQEEDRRQCLAAENGALGLPCIGVMESSDSMGKSRKRPRLEYDGLNHHVETGEA